MEVTRRADGLTVINDAYNANPESVRAALKALVAIASGRRSWAVLGQMAELGPDARDAHEQIGRLAVRLGVDRLVVVGDEAAAMHAGAVLEGSWSNESVHVADLEEAVGMLTEETGPDDVVLVKGSRVAGLERVAEAVLGTEKLGTEKLGTEKLGTE
jgi:UDP-N-acetylmuramoyl-tripeptide--D-alanyl-D-alanine ligase